MKGIQGLLLALGLGLAGAVCNWFYLERLAGREAKVSFIGIRADAQINVGDTLLDSHLVKVDIPRSAVGNLDQVAPHWKDLPLVAGWPSNRSYRGGELVLQQDIRTPGAKDLNDKLGRDEVALWIPIDNRTFNSMRVNPDDEVSFILPNSAVGGPSPTPIEGQPPPQPQPSGSANSDIVGTFRILELGNRTGRPEVQKAAGSRQTNENVIAIVSKFTGGRLEAKAERVTEYMRASKAQGLQVILHPKKRPGQ
ncbi:MAG: hypothetical protein H7062_23805 [Candidatus Saccharimonas sp.]|nr:hypothetical protein [Planctomycetaceae bacterium]